LKQVEVEGSGWGWSGGKNVGENVGETVNEIVDAGVTEDGNVNGDKAVVQSEEMFVCDEHAQSLKKNDGASHRPEMDLFLVYDSAYLQDLRGLKGLQKSRGVRWNIYLSPYSSPSQVFVIVRKVEKVVERNLLWFHFAHCIN